MSPSCLIGKLAPGESPRRGCEMTCETSAVVQDPFLQSRSTSNRDALRECPIKNVAEDVRKQVEQIAQSLVDVPDKVCVEAVQGEQAIVLKLGAAPEDVGKVIGKQGRTARSMRTILEAVSVKLKKRFTLEILEP